MPATGAVEWSCQSAASNVHNAPELACRAATVCADPCGLSSRAGAEPEATRLHILACLGKAADPGRAAGLRLPRAPEKS
jgi:hypothetical protein